MANTPSTCLVSQIGPYGEYQHRMKDLVTISLTVRLTNNE